LRALKKHKRAASANRVQVLLLHEKRVIGLAARLQHYFDAAKKIAAAVASAAVAM
jgi:hypothetical protein